MRKVVKMGMELEEWKYESCQADIAVGEDWATVYFIESTKQGEGHARTLLTVAKQHYESRGKVFGGSVALNARMRQLYKGLRIKEYS